MLRSALALAVLVSMTLGAAPSRQELLRDVRHEDEDVRPTFVRLTADQAKAQTNVALLEVDDGVMVVQSVEVELPKGDNSQYAVVEFEPPAVRDTRGKSVTIERQSGMLNPTRNSIEHRLLAPGGDAPATFSTVKGRVLVRVPLSVETRTIRSGDRTSLEKLGATIDGPFVRFRSGLIAEESFFSGIKPMRAYDASGKRLEREGLYQDEVNGDGFEMAAFHGSPATVEIDVPGERAALTLDYDLTYGDRKATKVTKQLGASVSSPDADDASAGNPEAVAELQRRGIAVDADQLLAAAVNGDTKIVALLLAAGIDVNAKGESGSTALHVATATREPEVVDQLLAAGADVNARDDKGLTPLFGLAFRCEETATIEKLLARGADPNIKGSSSVSPLALAKSMNCTDTVAALKKAGAK